MGLTLLREAFALHASCFITSKESRAPDTPFATRGPSGELSRCAPLLTVPGVDVIHSVLATCSLFDAFAVVIDVTF